MDGQTDGRTDRRTDRAISICLPKFLWGHKKCATRSDATTEKSDQGLFSLPVNSLINSIQLNFLLLTGQCSFLALPLANLFSKKVYCSNKFMLLHVE